MAKFTQSGRLKNRVKFKKMTRVQGEWGIEETEVIVGSFYCELRSQNMTEVQKNIGTVLEDTLTIIIRHQVGLEITSDMKAVINGVEYDIIKHTPDVARQQFDTVIVKARF